MVNAVVIGNASDLQCLFSFQAVLSILPFWLKNENYETLKINCFLKLISHYEEIVEFCMY